MFQSRRHVNVVPRGKASEWIACEGGGDGGDGREEFDGPPPDSNQEELDSLPPDRGREDPEVREGASPVTSRGTNVFVSAMPLGDFGQLEARLNARFAALEADFAAFEVRAQNEFGRFEESEDDAIVEVRGPSVIVSSFCQPAEMAQPIDATSASTQAMHAQRSRGGVTIEADRSNARRYAESTSASATKTGRQRSATATTASSGTGSKRNDR
jgi:hypothetical protein